MSRFRCPKWSGLFAAGMLLAISDAAQSSTGLQGPRSERRVELTAEQMFALAEEAGRRGDLAAAEAVYRALAEDPSIDLRSEARFRLAMMAVSRGRFADAAILLRRILDERPDAHRVRLELARILERMGDDVGARRALREAQAGGLPPDVARLVDRYSAALRARKPFGASIELAIAPDSNINRATRSETLGTVIGDFVLDEDSRERSGTGIAARGQAFVRRPIGERTNLLARISGSTDLYRHGDFNDLALGLSAGPEVAVGRDRIALEVGVLRRWYGGRKLSDTVHIGINWMRPVDRQSQLRTTLVAGIVDRALNPLQDGKNWSLSIAYERALSSRAGVAISLSAFLQDLQDPGYSIASVRAELTGYRDFGPTTVVGTLAYGRLESPERLIIYPRRRVDDHFRLSVAATFRQLAVQGFAPLVRIIAERNRSSIELFDYRRLRGEFGIARAF